MIAGAARILHDYLQVNDGEFKTIEDCFKFVYNGMIPSPSNRGKCQYPYKKERTKYIYIFLLISSSNAHTKILIK